MPSILRGSASSKEQTSHSADGRIVPVVEEETFPSQADKDASSYRDGDDDGEEENNHPQSRRPQAASVVCLLFNFISFGSAVAIGLVVFFYTRHVQDEEFRRQFQADADKIFKSVGASVDSTLSVMDNFVTMVRGQKDALNATFPFVPVANYPLQAARVKTLSRAFVMGMQYLVYDEDRLAWESFASQNAAFVQAAWDLQAQDRSFQGNMDTFPNIQDRIFANFPTLADRPEGTGPYLVNWNTYPIIYEANGAPYNYDIFAVPFLAKPWLTLLETKRPTLSSFDNVLDPSQDVIDSDQMIVVNYVRNFIPPDESPTEPFVHLLYPILDVDLDLSGDVSRVSDEDVAGTFSVSIFWRELLQDILPETSQGIRVVTQNTCGQIFTYEINGAQTLYVSNTDEHDSTYNHLETRATLQSLLDTSDANSIYYTGIPLSEATCPVTIRIYPSARLENYFRSDDPIIFAVGAGFIFLIVGALFCLYDFLVDRRKVC